MLAVGKAVCGAVTGTEHIAVCAHERSYVALSEFYQNVRFYFTQRRRHAFHEPVHRLVHRAAVHPLAEIVVLAEGIHKIELQTVKIPIGDGAAVKLDKMLAHLGITRVEHIRLRAAAAVERFCAEFFVYLAARADKGHRIPDHEFHSRRMHRVGKRTHRGHLIRRGLPVAAVVVAARIVGGLPAVVNYQHLGAEL